MGCWSSWGKAGREGGQETGRLEGPGSIREEVAVRPSQVLHDSGQSLQLPGTPEKLSSFRCRVCRVEPRGPSAGHI